MADYLTVQRISDTGRHATSANHWEAFECYPSGERRNSIVGMVVMWNVRYIAVYYQHDGYNCVEVYEVMYAYGTTLQAISLVELPTENPDAFTYRDIECPYPEWPQPA